VYSYGVAAFLLVLRFVEVVRLFLHEPCALVEARAAQVRGFGAVAVDVGKRSLCDLARVVRPFRCPRPEAATHSVRYALRVGKLARSRHSSHRKFAPFVET